MQRISIYYTSRQRIKSFWNKSTLTAYIYLYVLWPQCGIHEELWNPKSIISYSIGDFSGVFFRSLICLLVFVATERGQINGC